MGTIHKFKQPPPKNEQQFKGYQPFATGSARPGQTPRRLRFWRRSRPWQKSAMVWVLLIAAAGIVVGLRALLRM